MPVVYPTLQGQIESALLTAGLAWNNGAGLLDNDRATDARYPTTNPSNQLDRLSRCCLGPDPFDFKSSSSRRSGCRGVRVGPGVLAVITSVFARLYGRIRLNIALVALSCSSLANLSSAKQHHEPLKWHCDQ
ncbi:hypothetical protein DVH05_028367 [Phytophthora capsici]|nr:hypothetical protein DVH05_001801 [Phytophthora capsici]KAG1690159.1 hypothetical protein DVH05_028367 [Phytophthora capsici]